MIKLNKQIESLESALEKNRGENRKTPRETRNNRR